MSDPRHDCAVDLAGSDGAGQNKQIQGAQHSANPGADEPEHRGDRRRFLCWCVMLGVVKPERMVQRVVEEIGREVAL